MSPPRLSVCSDNGAVVFGIGVSFGGEEQHDALFAKAEGIVPAPESCHAIAATIAEANRCRATGEEKVLLFCLSGHGLMDMSAYDQFISGSLGNYTISDADIMKNVANL